MRLDDCLHGVHRVALDTPPLIYLIEANPGFDTIPLAVIRRAEEGRLRLFASVLVLTEVLVQPLRKGLLELAAQFRDILSSSGLIQLRPVDAATAEMAAQLRATYGLRTPDALHLGSAITSGCQVFLTNDADFKRITEVRVVLLSEVSV